MTCKANDVFVDSSILIAAAISPRGAAAIHAGVRYLATYDQRHLLRQSEMIKTDFDLIVTTPDDILAIS